MFKRSTPVSQKVMAILTNSDTPLSISQILALLENWGLHPNKTTVYRIIEKLEAQGILTTVPLKSGVSFYELKKDGHHHHHFCCETCDSIFCLDACHLDHLAVDFSSVLPNKDFQINAHDFNLYGICSSCSKKVA